MYSANMLFCWTRPHVSIVGIQPDCCRTNSPDGTCNIVDKKRWAIWKRYYTPCIRYTYSTSMLRKPFIGKKVSQLFHLGVLQYICFAEMMNVFTGCVFKRSYVHIENCSWNITEIWILMWTFQIRKYGPVAVLVTCSNKWRTVLCHTYHEYGI